MKLKAYVALLAVPLCFAAFGGEGHAQTVPLSGQIVSRSATSGSTSANVYTTPNPSAGTFVLTQFCSTSDVTLTAGVPFGFIASNVNGQPTCVSFSPGYVMPNNVPLTCSKTGPGLRCSISGVLETDN